MENVLFVDYALNLSNLPCPPNFQPAFSEGVKAFQDGKRITDNPYRYKEVDRPLFQMWVKGYRHAKHEAGFE